MEVTSAAASLTTQRQGPGRADRNWSLSRSRAFAGVLPGSRAAQEQLLPTPAMQNEMVCFNMNGARSGDIPRRRAERSFYLSRRAIGSCVDRRYAPEFRTSVQDQRLLYC